LKPREKEKEWKELCKKLNVRQVRKSKKRNQRFIPKLDS